MLDLKKCSIFTLLTPFRSWISQKPFLKFISYLHVCYLLAKFQLQKSRSFRDCVYLFVLLLHFLTPLGDFSPLYPYRDKIKLFHWSIYTHSSNHWMNPAEVWNIDSYAIEDKRRYLLRKDFWKLNSRQLKNVKRGKN